MPNIGFDHDDENEDEIQREVIRLEAEKRLMILHLSQLLPDFYAYFKPATPEKYTHKLDNTQLIHLVADYCGFVPPLDILTQCLRDAGHRQHIFTEEYPIKTYWIFN